MGASAIGLNSGSADAFGGAGGAAGNETMFISDVSIGFVAFAKLLFGTEKSSRWWIL
jgi:hypothetical protein